MSATADQAAAGQTPTTPKWSRRRRASVVPAIVVVVVVAGLFLPTLLGGWAPLLHYACQHDQTPEVSEYAWVPALLVNSPFGGEVFGNGTVPPGPLSVYGEGSFYELGEANGSAAWAGFRAEINVSSQENQTIWGPGQDALCLTPFYLSVRYWGGAVLGSPLLGEGNISDDHEPTALGHWTYPGDVNLTISNDFAGSNSRDVTTCGRAAAQNFTSSSSFEVKVPVTIKGSQYNVPYVLPIRETFHYIFPANFGIWQVDNLSAPGGPGGGWAFSYSPCP
jgi:hypothetical protein